MNILMIVPDCYIIDRRVLQEARSLVQAGHTVNVLAGFECPEETSFTWHGVNVWRYRYDWDDERLKKIRRFFPKDDKIQTRVNKAFRYISGRFLSLSAFDVFVIEKARRFRADIVHVHDLPVLKHGTVLAKEWKAPLVFDAHEIYYEHAPLPAYQRKELEWRERKLMPKVNLLITVNNEIADYFEKRYGKKPLVLFNCAESPSLEEPGVARKRLRDAAGLPGEAKVVLYQGWISGERNLETLVRSVEHFPEGAYLAVIGYGDYEKVLREVLEDKPWKDKVRFLGKIEPDDIMMMTAGADLGVIPYQPIDLNHRLCSPNKFFEYVQTGVPVVAHDLPFFRQMKEAHSVVSVGDLSTPQGMADAINWVLGDDVRLESMRAACIQAGRVINWENEEKKLLSAYAGLKGVRSR